MEYSKTFACWLSIVCALRCGGALDDVHSGQVLVHDVGPVFVDAEPEPSARPVFGQTPASESQADRLRTLAYGFLANRQALSDFVWEFEKAKCVAESIEDARALRFQERYVMEGIWVVRGESVRYELLCPAIEMEQPKPGAVIQPGRWVTVECASRRYLFDGHIRLSDAPGLLSANLFIGKGPPRLVATPFSSGSMGANEERGPGVGILKGLSGEWFVRYLGREERNGRLLEVVDVGRDPASPDQLMERWFMDPAQGYLPLEGWYFGGEETPRAKSFITGIRQTDHGVYYPHVSMAVLHLYWAPSYQVDVYRTNSLSIGTPADADFRLELAARTNVIDMRDMRRSVSSPEPRSIGLQDLETLVDECSIRQPQSPQPPEQAKPSRGARVVLMVGTALLAALIVTLAATTSRRRRRKVASSLEAAKEPSS